MTHNYILPLKLLANSYPVIFYDQSGCGESYIADPRVNAPHLFTLDYYLEELHTLIQHYKLKEYYVYGSSWGTIVTQEFAVTRPAGLLGN